MQTTYMAKPHEIERRWYIIDAAGRPLGRVATEAARLLKGKHKAIYTPHIDTGDHVIVLNAARVVLTGKKPEQKIHYRYSGYPGGLKMTDYATLMAKNPERAVYLAVKGMLPHNRLGRVMLKKLRVYRDDQHPHEAQKPLLWEGPEVNKEGGPALE
ncbi:MAG: 50S ribosomal protein L13 [Dethiobacteria bacterium]|mgnify:CR=1 FL=1|jgi:large subunit ribosomal protein L13|nr:50S ribosomal protein L13 [Bacillota bacterium]NMD34088.1 50S ribosomal protein L13 [Bacillota bacterium]HOB29130.1 50S ribosomal protein L13 [Bacillota bacterium]HPZ41702.1 50S ribosomal protein L13 [Bacillota bacterium]HQD52244.1 50S ribosomal protein L13 [Bacillota bacterium]